MTLKNKTDNLEVRVGVLEGTLVDLAGEVKETNRNLIVFASELRGSVDKLVDSVANIKTALVQEIGETKSSFATQLIQKNKPDWSIIFAIGALVTTIIVMSATLIAFIFSGQNERINVNTDKISSIQENQIAESYIDGATEQWRTLIDEKIKKAELNIEALKDKSLNTTGNITGITGGIE